jgi:hypothetical protein
MLRAVILGVLEQYYDTLRLRVAYNANVTYHIPHTKCQCVVRSASSFALYCASTANRSTEHCAQNTERSALR